MGLSSRTVQIKIKSSGDVFHELWKTDPHQVPSLTPTTIQNCQTHEDGKDRVSKTQIMEIDEGKKSITFKLLEGDLTELYKTFIIHVHVDTHGLSNLVTWTVEYEKLSPDVPDPDTLMEFYEKVTKDIETHHLKN
ncbi:kirola isoform X2 [Lactuca sativa]|uniref:kirola isoform X2 n=1 Tax=Lactuca sativa TaxID=4236 RepID=UPI000CD8A176|nr:kirola isoform X2 [Lactuca sativa]